MKILKYIPKTTKCPYLSTNNNSCSRKGAVKRCIYTKNVEKCKYYNEWLKDKKCYENGSINELELLEVKDGI